MTKSPKNRLDLTPGCPTMKAVVTTGNGGYDKLEYRDVPVPKPEAGEVLVKVLAAGVNNTEINTRLGWYSSKVTGSTEKLSGGNEEGEAAAEEGDGGWSEATPFPFIQGTDCCGQVESLTTGVDKKLLGKRVLIRSCMRSKGWDSFENIWMASDFDGAFSQYVKVPATEVFPVDCDWTDEELGTLPCAYGTAENMLHRAGVSQGDRVLITGASGGVGSAALQLAKRRGAYVIAVAGEAKREQVKAIGADRVIKRGEDLVALLGEKSINVVVDNVAGPGFAEKFKLLNRGGRYVSSGAIAGPMVEVDLRDIYLKDLTIIGCTAWDEPVFPNLISYIERGEIKPLVAATFPLKDIVRAQKEFSEKKHVGKFVLVPPKHQGL
jgi:NADPH:quinone reductase-like Zn-dependent oxidoreductase